ncbi:MAG: metal-dependent hydrolase, partial [Chthoniobacteraceae bacterium]|nr:metal-dependent hydrolase [Chthoniobacteraceae bacterium]
TVSLVLDAGFWAGITLYPESKATPARAVDMVERAGMQNIWLNCACDWGRSEPLAVPQTALEMRRRGHSAKAVDDLIYGNPFRFLSQSPRFKIE